MNPKLQNIFDIIQQTENISAEEKGTILKALKDAEKELEITSFKLDRTEKVKRTTAILLEETIDELEQKRKAVEKQNRELEIEAALERVRSKAMAMYSSEDLALTVDAFFSELRALNVKPRRCGVGIVDEESRIVDIHASTDTHEKEIKKIAGNLKLSGHPVLDNIFENWKQQKEYHPVLRGNEILDYYKIMNPQVTFPDFADDETQYGYYFFFKEGGVFAWTDKELADRDIQIFRRYTSVLSLTYRRYMDLKEAEAQAREAQIETALERVRARTMAMQKSEELAKVSLVLFEQVKKLGIETWTTGFNIWQEGETTYIDWVVNGSTGKFMKPYKVDLTAHPFFVEISKAKKRGDDFFVIQAEGERLKEHYRLLSSMAKIQFEDLQKSGLQLPEHQINHFVFGKKVSLMFITFEPCPEAHDIFKRFGKVFEQTYTRFLDLEMAEAQNKIIQAENERKTQELEEARQLQLAMLPKEIPQLSKLDIAVYMQTATEVGGDYYDFSFMHNGSLNVAIGDATGHGMKAGTMVTMIKSLFTANSSSAKITDFFKSTNAAIKNSNLKRMMISFAMLNIYGNYLTVLNAGMPPVYYLNKSTRDVKELGGHNLPLGAMHKSKYDSENIELIQGDVVLMLSDGFPELQNNKNEMYGYERLKEVLKNNGNKSAEEIIFQLKEDSTIWANGCDPDDDITFVVVKVK